MRPEDLQVVPAAKESTRVERNAALGAGGGWWRFMMAALGVAVMLAGGCGYAAGAGEGGAEKAGEKPAGQGGDKGSAEGGLGHPSLGSPDAPVTMIEYSDFQCPFCGKFARETEPELVEKYVKDGTLRIEWRDFPYLGQESANAAFAARAAQAQGEFWRYHDLLYENQGAVNSGAFSDEDLLGFAREVGLDVGRFEKDMKGGKYEESVAADFEEGQAAGVTGTPTFVINGETLVGAQPIGVFEEAIEQAADNAAQGSEGG